MEKNSQNKLEKAKVYNLIILDKSGSMNSIRRAAIDGLNETLGAIRSAQDSYAETQEHYVTILPFCGCSMRYIMNCVPIAKVHNISEKEYVPCCMTPLYDAMGKGINELFHKIEGQENATVAVTIITDGMENASKEYRGSAIKELVERMRDEYGWNFAYIGTNQDVDAVARDLSIDNTMFFYDDEDGMRRAWEREHRSKRVMYAKVHNFVAEAKAESDSPSFFGRISKIREMMRSNRNYREMSEFTNRITPDHITSLENNQIFVFGSNPEGQHNGGAAMTAVNLFGAQIGVGEGLQGQSYAIPTTQSLRETRAAVERFLTFAEKHPDMTFLVTRVGCGNAGHSISDMAAMFVRAIDIKNVWLPIDFWEEIL